MLGATRAAVTRQEAAAGGTPADTGMVLAGAGANIDDAGTFAWATPGNIIASDNSKATNLADDTGQTTDILVSSSHDFSSIPAGATIDGIIVRIEKQRQRSDAQQRDHTIRLTKDGSTMVGDNKADTATDWPNPDDGLVDHGGAADLWGTTWTAAEIKASTFGVMIKGQCVNSPGGASNMRVDAVWIEVHYTA